MDHAVPLTTSFYVWFIGIPVSYIALSLSYRACNWWPKPAEKGTRLSDIMAFEIVAGVTLAYMGIAGSIIWFQLNPNWDYTGIVEDKYLGYSKHVEDHLLMPMLTYQAWQTVLCLILPDIRDWSMIGHHTVTSLLAYVCLHPALHYYACFFFGVAETTNLPLSIIDTFKYFPEYKKRFPMLDMVAQGAFALGFYGIRIFYWSMVQYELFNMLIPKLLENTVHSRVVVCFFAGAALFLSALQWWWGFKIAQSIADVVRGTGSTVKNDQDSNVKKTI